MAQRARITALDATGLVGENEIYIGGITGEYYLCESIESSELSGRDQEWQDWKWRRKLTGASKMSNS